MLQPTINQPQILKNRFDFIVRAKSEAKKINKELIANPGNQKKEVSNRKKRGKDETFAAFLKKWANRGLSVLRSGETNKALKSAKKPTKASVEEKQN